MISIRKYDPFERLTRDMEGFLGQPFRFPGFFQAEDPGVFTCIPKMDVNEQENRIVVSLDLPGMSEKEISVNLENNVLTISGERKFQHDETKDNFHRIERSFGKFSRSFTLPAMVDSSKIEAHYANGVLEVILPKSEESKPKQISIKVG